MATIKTNKSFCYCLYFRFIIFSCQTYIHDGPIGEVFEVHKTDKPGG